MDLEKALIKLSSINYCDKSDLSPSWLLNSSFSVVYFGVAAFYLCLNVWMFMVV